MNYAVYNTLVILGAFLLGGIPFGYLITRLFGAGDIRKQGSGNIGATNVWRVVGAPAGAITLVLDFAKSAIPVLLVSGTFATWCNLSQELPLAIWIPLGVGVAAILGHVYTPFLGFKGGKGVITAFGALVALLPIASLVGLLVFVLVAAVSRYISLGSILGSLALAGTVSYQYFFGSSTPHIMYLYFSIAIALLILYTHRQNIKRIFNSSENRFSFKKK